MLRALPQACIASRQRVSQPGAKTEPRRYALRSTQPPFRIVRERSEVGSHPDELRGSGRHDRPSRVQAADRFPQDYHGVLGYQRSNVVQRAVAPPAASNPSGPSEATLSLLSTAREMEVRLADASRLLGANPTTEARQQIAAVAVGIEQLRAVASGADEKQKLAISGALAKISLSRAPAGPAQQTSAVARMPLRVSEPDDASEVEAERAADAIIHGSTARIGSTGHPPTLYRSNGAAALAGTLTAFELAGGGEAEAVTGPPGWVVGAAIGLTIVAALAIAAATTTTRRPCPPCPPNPPPEIDRVPPSAPHWPCPGDHWHYRVYNQNPTTCQCFLSGRKFGGCLPQGGFPP